MENSGRIVMAPHYWPSRRVRISVASIEMIFHTRQHWNCQRISFLCSARAAVVRKQLSRHRGGIGGETHHSIGGKFDRIRKMVRELAARRQLYLRGARVE